MKQTGKTTEIGINYTKGGRIHLRMKNDADLKEALEEYITSTSAFECGNTFFSFESPGARGNIKEIHLAPDLAVSLIDVETSEPFQFYPRMAVSDMVEAGFALEGRVEFSVKGIRQDFDMYPGQGALTIAGGEMEGELRIAPGQRVRVAEIRFTAESFESYSASSDWVLPASLSAGASGSGHYRGSRKCACLMTAEMDRSVRALLDCGFAAHENPEGMEDLCVSCTGELVSYLRQGMGNTRTVLSSADLERVREARDILFRSMENPPGLHELSRMVNLNDYKLKTGFRQAFGSTVHRTLTEMRLQRAFHMLHKRECSVTEAALGVGCSNVGDFGIAFKRRFNMSPGKLRNGS